VIGLIRWAMTRSDVGSGPLNVVAPNPVTSRDLAGAIGRALGRPAVLPVPALAVRLLAGGVADAVLASQRVIPERAQRSAIAFAFPPSRPLSPTCCRALSDKPGQAAVTGRKVVPQPGSLHRRARAAATHHEPRSVRPPCC
jgi:hypothetical protein